MFEFFYGEKPTVIASFLEFGHIAYITKRENIRKQLKKKRTRPLYLGTHILAQDIPTICTNLIPRVS